MVSRIWRNEGLFGFGKGFSACFYGGAVSGFVYFAFYKQFKTVYKEVFGKTIDMALVYMAASLTAEMLTLGVQYPYDLIKCRLQSVNQEFKYKNLPHAFSKEVTENGIMSLYKGSIPFLITYAAYVGI